LGAVIFRWLCENNDGDELGQDRGKVVVPHYLACPRILHCLFVGSGVGSTTMGLDDDAMGRLVWLIYPLWH
jgi:hypothetical protein